MQTKQNNSEPIRHTFLDGLKRMVDGRIFKAGNNEYDPSIVPDPFEPAPAYKDKVKAVKECLDAANELPKYIKDKYKKLLKIKDKRELPKWIYNDTAIKKALEKTRFENVYYYIVKNTLPREDAINLAEELNIEKYKTTVKSGEHKGKAIESYYVLFTPEYLDMENELNLSIKSIQKYLQKFCEIDILVNLGKTDSRGNSVYGVGYWSSYTNIKNNEKQLRRILFLKETPEIKESLRSFKIRN
jgi:hypothetical protein